MTLEPVPLRWPHLAASGEPQRSARDEDHPLTEAHPRTNGGGHGEGSRVEQELERARQLGRVEGLAETQALRRELAALCRVLAEQRRALAAELSESIVDVALVVVEAWLEGGDADRRARLLPVVARWVRELGAETLAIAQVAPDDAAVLRELVVDLRIEVRADPGLSPGDVRLRSERSLLELRWRDRLGELRGELIAMLREAPASPASPGGEPPEGRAGGEPPEAGP